MYEMYKVMKKFKGTKPIENPNSQAKIDKRVKARLERKNDLGDASVDNSRLKEMIAEELGVRTKDVEMMESRLSGSDYSLNAPQADEEGRGKKIQMGCG